MQLESSYTMERFIGQKDKDIKEIEESFYVSSDKAFEIWSVKLIENLSDYAEAYNYCEVGGKNDKGVDAYISELSEDRTVRIFQSKDHAKPNYNESRSSITELTGSIKWLKKEDVTSIIKDNNEFIQCSARYKDAVKKNYSVILKLAIWGDFSEVEKKQIEIERNNLPENHSLEVYNIKKLKQIYEENLSLAYLKPLEAKVTIKVKKEELFVKKNEARDKDIAVVATVNASELSNLFEEYKYMLFHQNVRYYKGVNTEPSKNMKTTLQDEEGPSKFWFFNNGISLVCGQFNYPVKDENGEENYDYIELLNPQIINGCQTTVTLNHLKEKLDNSEVLVRITATEDEMMASNISESTNTQNKVSAKDLRANDPIQRNLKIHFANLEINEKKRPFYYITKNGEKEMLRGTANPAERNNFLWKYASEQRATYKSISSDQVAKAYYSFIGNPHIARSSPGKLFEKDGGYYDEIFKNGVSEKEFLLPCLLLSKVEEKKTKKVKEYNIFEQTNPQDITDRERRKFNNERPIKYASTYIVALIAEVFKMHYKVEDINFQLSEKLLEKLISDNNNEMFDQLYKYCASTIENHTKNKGTDFDPSNAYKDLETFTELKQELLDHLEVLKDNNVNICSELPR